MALNFTVSYTFSPSTTISSSQVNTNTNDVAAVFQGLEAETKTLAKLKVDIDPTAALNVATKQYVDHYSTWRRPVLQFLSVSTVSVESGLDGTSGDIPILFPDGSVRTETSATRTTFNITRNAILTTASAQSGLRSSLSEAANTWYALYAVKVTDSTTQWCTVGDTTLPVQASYATLNGNFGTSGWVYLGMIRNGDNLSATTDIVNFAQTGNLTQFTNNAAGNVFNYSGIQLAGTASATSLTYNYSAGTGATTIPSQLTNLIYYGASNAGTSRIDFKDTGNAVNAAAFAATSAVCLKIMHVATFGLRVSNGSAVSMDIGLAGFFDGILGVGSNPIL